ncbi:hypothetical protein ADIS_3838 [Lunatimonas lonarensis]|uniref:Thiamine pyrophosphokinase n=1 Tax=Lunatimonas lonarensis TaxID=1232681 RepID=R7ZNQ7_9BACT|nr:hypothetical protein [Lunatimonas lonarensis]EON75688.1 hypothetical protein ADIS_3838 [Lunatimonas lonarensis]
MSSHHFVRENQEPALFLIQPEQLSSELLGELLEWVPTVITTEEMLGSLHDQGVKIDAVVLNIPPSPLVSEIIQEQHPIVVVDRQEQTYLSAGLEHLLSVGQSAVNLVGVPYRDTHLLEEFLYRLDIILFDGPIRYFPVKETPFKKWMNAGSIHIHGAEDSFVEIGTGNQTEVIQLKDATFLEVDEGHITFKSKGLFWVGEFVGSTQ